MAWHGSTAEAVIEGCHVEIQCATVIHTLCTKQLRSHITHDCYALACKSREHTVYRLVKNKHQQVDPDKQRRNER